MLLCQLFNRSYVQQKFCWQSCKFWIRSKGALMAGVI